MVESEGSNVKRPTVVSCMVASFGEEVVVTRKQRKPSGFLRQVLIWKRFLPKVLDYGGDEEHDQVVNSTATPATKGDTMRSTPRTATPSYDAIVEMKAIADQIPGTWKRETGESFAGGWQALDLTLADARVRLCTEDLEADLKLHIFTGRGALRYTIDLGQVPRTVALAAVKAAVDETCGIVR